MQTISSLEALEEFLLPWRLPEGTSDETQLLIRLGFASLIFGLAIVTSVCLVRNAKRINWERNWLGAGLAGGTTGQLDVEHGSVNDISIAVRTRSESLAAAMPGVLLVIGLLGTFIGLGLALTEASLAITAGANSSTPPAEVSSALGEMMKGLGYKFATSTWGIIGYLLLRCVSAVGGYEERRLRWCIDKMREVLDDERRRRAHAAKLEETRYSGLLAQILKAVASNATSSEAIRISSLGTETILGQFIKSMDGNIRTMGESSSSMAASAKSVGASAELLGNSASALQETVETFDVSVKGTLDNVRKDLTEAIETLKSTTTKSMADIARDLGTVTTRLSETLDGIRTDLKTTLEDIGDQSMESNENIASAITKLSTTVDGTLAQLKTTLEQMADSGNKANANFRASTQQILTLVATTDNMVKAIKEDILRALSTVAAGNTETRKIFVRFDKIATRNEAATAALIDALGTMSAPTRPRPARNEGWAVRFVRKPRKGAAK